MSIFDAIAQKDLDNFIRQLKVPGNVLSRDEYGYTILHRLALITDFGSTKAALASIFSSKHNLRSWLIEIGWHKVRELILIQNTAQQTCMHIAVENDNWTFAGALAGELNYRQCPENLRRNRLGLTEYELAIVLYGVSGRTEGIRAVFGGIDRVYAGQLGEVTPFRGASDIYDSLPIFKKAAKAVKVVRLPLKNGNTINVTIPFDDPRYQIAQENDYPSGYATIEDPEEIGKLYEEQNIAPNLRSLQ